MPPLRACLRRSRPPKKRTSRSRRCSKGP